jgi:signal transduction histidine kinase
MPFLLKSLHRLDKRHPAGVVAICLAMICGIGVVGYGTGPFLSTSLLYLIPLLLITRSAGLGAGITCSLLAATLWLLSDLRMLSYLPQAHPVTPYWNMMMRLGTFLVAVSLVAATRSLNAHLEERVNERTAELEAQIAETQQLEKTILEISDRERESIGQDLHDGLCQQLVGAAFGANLLLDKLTKDPGSCGGDAARIADLIDDSITQARNLARGLYPVRLETEGLEMAVRELASTLGQRFGIPCHVECPEPLHRLGEGVGIHLYRIIQEAVTNAAKHADARKILIHLSADSSHFFLKVQDDGVGIDRANINPQGMGLSIMDYRARMIGADFRVARLSTGGTEVVCVVGR